MKPKFARTKEICPIDDKYVIKTAFPFPESKNRCFCRVAFKCCFHLTILL